MRENVIMSIRRLLPKVMQNAGYFDHARLQKRVDILKTIRVDLEFMATQNDGANCGMFYIAFLDHYC